MSSSRSHRQVDAIIIGAGPSGIAMAHSLKHKLGFEDFMIYDKLDGPGGTWLTNSYPGCGCDIPSHLYSFSFNLNPNWTKELCDQPEILSYMNATVDKFKLRSHMNFGVECVGAEWKDGLWHVNLKDIKTGISFAKVVNVFISAVGGISYPRDINFQGMDRFKGDMFHSARWDHQVDYTDKRIGVIGNGCSAAQIVPVISQRAAFVKQYARSAQWYHERPNKSFSGLQKFCYKYIPLWQRFHRLLIFLASDSLVTTYVPGEAACKKRVETERQAKDYIYSRTPKKYHSFIVPTFPLGCKRRIFDPGYLDSLHNINVELVHQGIQEIDETGIVGSDGKHTTFDIIVLATGFQVSKFLTPMEVIGSSGITLTEQWGQCRGAQAYMGSFIHDFPNFAILFGPNTFPAHNSALFTCEVQVEYVMRTLMAPLIDKRASIIEVKQTAENQFVNSIHSELNGSVFAAGCTNWYINEFGRNAASWPGLASAFWKAAYFPEFKHYNMVPGQRLWWLNSLKRRVVGIGRHSGNLAIVALLFVALSSREKIAHRIGMALQWLKCRSI